MKVSHTTVDYICPTFTVDFYKNVAFLILRLALKRIGDNKNHKKNSIFTLIYVDILVINRHVHKQKKHHLAAFILKIHYFTLIVYPFIGSCYAYSLPIQCIKLPEGGCTSRPWFSHTNQSVVCVLPSHLDSVSLFQPAHLSAWPCFSLPSWLNELPTQVRTAESLPQNS